MNLDLYRVRNEGFSLRRSCQKILDFLTDEVKLSFINTASDLALLGHLPLKGKAYLFSIATAVSSAIFIIWVNAVWRSSAVVSTPFKMWSLMVQMQRPRLP